MCVGNNSDDTPSHRTKKTKRVRENNLRGSRRREKSNRKACNKIKKMKSKWLKMQSTFMPTIRVMIL